MVIGFRRGHNDSHEAMVTTDEDTIDGNDMIDGNDSRLMTT